MSVFAVNNNFSTGRFIQKTHQIKKSAFAGTGPAHNGDKFSVFGFKINAFQHFCFGLAVDAYPLQYAYEFPSRYGVDKNDDKNRDRGDYQADGAQHIAEHGESFNNIF